MSVKKIECLAKNINITDGDRLKNIKRGEVAEVSADEAKALAARGFAKLIGGKPRAKKKT